MKIPAEAPPQITTHPERERIRGYGLLAVQLLPDHIGRLVKRELDAHADFGWRTELGSLMPGVMADLDAELARQVRSGATRWTGSAAEVVSAMSGRPVPPHTPDPPRHSADGALRRQSGAHQ